MGREPLASLRLNAYRRGQQDFECLVMPAPREGRDREAVSLAAAADFQEVSDADLDALRPRVAHGLAER